MDTAATMRDYNLYNLYLLRNTNHNKISPSKKVATLLLRYFARFNGPKVCATKTNKQSNEASQYNISYTIKLFRTV